MRPRKLVSRIGNYVGFTFRPNVTMISGLFLLGKEIPRSFQALKLLVFHINHCEPPYYYYYNINCVNNKQAELSI